MLSWIQKVDLSLFTEPQYRKVVTNKFHISQTQVKTTGKIDIHINEKERRENVQIASSVKSSHLRKVLCLKSGAQYVLWDKFLRAYPSDNGKNYAFLHIQTF